MFITESNIRMSLMKGQNASKIIFKIIFVEKNIFEIRNFNIWKNYVTLTPSGPQKTRNSHDVAVVAVADVVVADIAVAEFVSNLHWFFCWVF